MTPLLIAYFSTPDVIPLSTITASWEKIRPARSNRVEASPRYPTKEFASIAILGPDEVYDWAPFHHLKLKKHVIIGNNLRTDVEHFDLALKSLNKITSLATLPEGKRKS